MRGEFADFPHAAEGVVHVEHEKQGDVVAAGRFLVGDGVGDGEQPSAGADRPGEADQLVAGQGEVE